MNVKIITCTLLALFFTVAFADDETPAPAAATAPAKPEKPVKVKKPSVTINVNQYPLLAKKPSASKHGVTSYSLYHTTTSTTYQMKWDCSVRVRERVPEGLTLEVYYIGQDPANKWVQIGETKTQALTLNDKGIWTGELLSPETHWTETKHYGNNNGDKTPEKQGERIKGCIVRVLGEGKIWKTFTSDPRWAKVAKKDTFTIDELNPNKSRIGSK